MFPPITTETAQLALDTINLRPTRGIPTGFLHLCQHAHIERVAGVEPGAYKRDPHGVYVAAQRAMGVCLLDQYLATNPLEMDDAGVAEGSSMRDHATTGAGYAVLDGMVIDSPEAVLEHLERIVLPRLRRDIASFDEERRVREIIAGEVALQERLGPGILKTGYGFVAFPTLGYYTYGYGPYLMAYALYPEVMERYFSLAADYAVLNNRAAARAYREGGLPPLYRLDSDLADSRGMLVDIRSLDRLWLPHFCRAIEPLVRANVRLIWHCDGNLMALVPRLLEAGVRGFQGFQYEDGMDYERICAMKTRDGEDLFIIGGVSVTRTLPFGTPADVKREIDWLVEKGPCTGLVLAASSSIVPGVPWENIEMLLEGLKYYRTHGKP